MTELADAFPEPPTDHHVRQCNRYRINTEKWRKWWPAHLEQPSSLTTTEESAVTRQELYDRAASVQTPADAIDLYVLVCGWGSGTSALGTWRRARSLQQASASVSLLRTHELSRTGDLVDAYRSLRAGRDRIKWFGPAFSPNGCTSAGTTPTTLVLSGPSFSKLGSPGHWAGLSGGAGQPAPTCTTSPSAGRSGIVVP